MQKIFNYIIFTFIYLALVICNADEEQFPEATFVEGKGYILISQDKKLQTNYCHKNNPNSTIFDDDFWGYPGMPYISQKIDFSDVDPISVVTQKNARAVINHFFKSFERDSFDGKGTTLISIVHCKEQGDGNAQWTGKYMAFGEKATTALIAPAEALDVFAHEFTHGIVQFTSRLSSEDEEGALNEGFADIMGIYAKCKITPENCSYLFGEKLSADGEAIRSLSDPTKYHAMDYYDSGAFSNHGSNQAHSGAGIVGLAFYLLSEGGQHPTRPNSIVSGIGQDKAAQIFFKAFTNRISSPAQFSDLRIATLIEAEQYGYDTKQTMNSVWNLLGVK